MKNLLAWLGFVALFISCNSSAVRNNFSEADSLVLHFKNEIAGIVTKTVQTTDANAIRKIIGFIDSKPADSTRCRYDGKIFFYKQGQLLQEVDFNMKDSQCNHFSFLLNGTLLFTKVNQEALDFFNALEKGYSFY